jgi:hypothetical protein
MVFIPGAGFPSPAGINPDALWYALMTGLQQQTRTNHQRTNHYVRLHRNEFK